MATVSDLAPVQTALATAWGRLGTLLGTSYDWYVPNGANAPLASPNDQGSFLCYFDRDPQFPAVKAREYGKPEYFVAYDRAGPNVGDYLVSEGADETYFIIDQDYLTPTKVVSCNTTVDLYRPGAVTPTTADATRNFVRTSPKGDGILIASGWPISLVSGSRGEKAVSGLPEAGREPWFNFLCPAIPGVRLRADDKIVDDDGFRYQISACEKTQMGFRGTARLAQG